ncbi:TPA: hypothetical protein QDA88_005205 [Burkholderia vietnamiensis]|nr:hypothetical protein [Burkholderia vietnamiensis]
MLVLKDIQFGSTDAKNEVLSNTPEEISRFLASFVEPPSLSAEKFYNRQKYFIVGLKGTGKTALLRYVSLKLEEDENSTSSFVLFKSDVDEDLKKDFSHAARVQLAEENSEDYDGDDYETVWRWFIYRKIAAVLLDGNVKPFQENSSLSAFIALVSSEALDKSERAGFLRLVPRIRKGTVEISHSPKLGLEFDWDENGRAKVKFNDLVRQADDAFKKLDPSTERLNVFFDELELNYASNKQYQRDARLVRDLIVSIERLNATCKAKGFQVCLYAAIRSEVLNAVDALGKEINKPVADFGSVIQWNRPGLDAVQQPLLNIIEQRINSARATVSLPPLSSEKMWEEYFPVHIHQKKPQIYILHNSWYRPRDVVRLLISIQDQYPNEKSFILQGIEAIRKPYSTASWVELTEELKARYKPSEIDGIKYIFYGFRQVFSFSELSTRAEKVAKEHADTKTLLERVDLRVVMKDLYRIGIIGNIDKRSDRMRFSFRGDDEIIFDWDFFVHTALKAHLSI